MYIYEPITGGILFVLNSLFLPELSLALLMFLTLLVCLVAEPDKVLVGELNKWVANPLGPGQTSALQIKTRSA